MRDFFSLLGLNFIVRWRNFKDFLKTAYHYYSNPLFRKADLILHRMYCLHSPFSISKQFLFAKGEKDIYAYGETPLTTLKKIAEECHITKNDCVYELGCGRGRTCFWLYCFIGCRVVGIEFIPEFVKNSQYIAEKLKMDHLTFELADMLQADLTGATVCYLYGTCLDEPAIKTLIDKFAKLPTGTKIITVSYPLTDYIDSPCFTVIKCFTGMFTWGETEIYLHIVEK